VAASHARFFLSGVYQLETEMDEREDGSDPRAFHDRRRRHRMPTAPVEGRKALQLCGQVRDALHGILAGCADEAVRNLTVIAVAPAPHTGRLMVTVAGPAPADVADRAHVADRLARAAGWVRSEVAARVSRRHAPELVFQLE
jgi:ribosome-binding factor A